MIQVQAQVLGTPELKAEFRRLDSAIRERLKRKLLDLGASLRDLAKSLAPRKSGHLQDSIRARLRETNDTLTETVGKPAWYGRFIELGLDTMRNPRRSKGIVGVRTITTKSGTVLVSPRRGFLRAQGQPKRFVIRADPFLGPAMNRIAPTIPRELQQVIAEEVQS